MGGFTGGYSADVYELRISEGGQHEVVKREKGLEKGDVFVSNGTYSLGDERADGTSSNFKLIGGQNVHWYDAEKKTFKAYPILKRAAIEGGDQQFKP